MNINESFSTKLENKQTFHAAKKINHSQLSSVLIHPISISIQNSMLQKYIKLLKGASIISSGERAAG